MSTGKIIGYVVSAILILFGVLFLLAAPVGNTGGRLAVGVVLIVVGLGIIVIVKLREPKPEQRIVHEVELPGDLSLEQMKCRNCGAPLDQREITLVHGALNVRCPYCGAAYEIEEEPKW
ncbi:MAG: hypothetical protein ACYC1C_12545 [Chloroflexota bacterium]